MGGAAFLHNVIIVGLSPKPAGTIMPHYVKKLWESFCGLVRIFLWSSFLIGIQKLSERWEGVAIEEINIFLDLQKNVIISINEISEMKQTKT